jgi:hypothetical protein
MARNRIWIILFYLLFSAGNPVLNAQQVPAGLVQAFAAGDADALSPFFNQRLQLTLLGVEHRVSRSQAQEIIRDFFRKYPSLGFEIIFKGDKADSNFVIGKLKSKSDSFRVNLFMKKVNDEYLLHLLEIEKDNGSTF